MGFERVCGFGVLRNAGCLQGCLRALMQQGFWGAPCRNL